MIPQRKRAHIIISGGILSSICGVVLVAFSGHPIVEGVGFVYFICGLGLIWKSNKHFEDASVADCKGSGE